MSPIIPPEPPPTRDDLYEQVTVYGIAATECGAAIAAGDHAAAMKKMLAEQVILLQMIDRAVIR